MTRGKRTAMFWATLATTALLTAPARAEEAVALGADVVIDAAKLPFSATVDVKEAGALTIRLLSSPKGFAFHCSWPDRPKGTWAPMWGQARLPAGKHRFVLKDRWGAKHKGEIKLRVEVAAGVDPTEPANGSAAGARAVSFADTKAGPVPIRLFPVGDADWLRFDVPEPGYVVLSVPKLPKGLAPWGTIYDQFGTDRGTNAARIDFAGPVTIHFRDRWSGWSTPNPVGLKIDHVPEIDLLEPNDAPAQATRLRPGDWVEIAMAPWGDTDHFRVAAPGKGTLLCQWRDAPLDVVVALVDESGKVLRNGWQHDVAPGEHVLRVKARWSDYKLKAFPFRVTFLPAGADAAQQLEIGKPVRLRDTGPHKLTIAPGKPGLVHVDAVGALSPVVFLAGNYKLRRTTVRSDGSPVSVEVRPKASPSFHLYSVIARFEPEFDRLEPNDRQEQAQPLTPGKEQWLYLFPTLDEDWFFVETNAKARLVCSLSLETGPLGESGPVPLISLHGADGKEIGRLPDYTNKMGDYYGGLAIPEAGRWFVRVATRSWGGRLPLRLMTRLYEEGAAEAPGAVDLRIVGVELDDKTAGWMRDYAAVGGGSYLDAKKAKEITPRLREAVAPPPEPEPEAAETPTDGTEDGDDSSGSMLWLYVLLAVIGTFVLLAARR